MESNSLQRRILTSFPGRFRCFKTAQSQKSMNIRPAKDRCDSGCLFRLEIFEVVSVWILGITQVRNWIYSSEVAHFNSNNWRLRNLKSPAWLMQHESQQWWLVLEIVFLRFRFSFVIFQIHYFHACSIWSEKIYDVISWQFWWSCKPWLFSGHFCLREKVCCWICCSILGGWKIALAR